MMETKSKLRSHTTNEIFKAIAVAKCFMKPIWNLRSHKIDEGYIKLALAEKPMNTQCLRIRQCVNESSVGIGKICSNPILHSHGRNEIYLWIA